MILLPRMQARNFFLVNKIVVCGATHPSASSKLLVMPVSVPPHSFVCQFSFVPFRISSPFDLSVCSGVITCMLQIGFAPFLILLLKLFRVFLARFLFKPLLPFSIGFIFSPSFFFLGPDAFAEILLTC